ncbi:MAG: galactose ABC transporter substrate-binding protein [Deltaproteobacteria bacterium]|jgi:methyl-galactoside transport system substrate-binding protein|nr:galactose ABC transporter substrate-binding protein [Deltaproteobacteria bacterium]
MNFYNPGKVFCALLLFVCVCAVSACGDEKNGSASAEKPGEKPLIGVLLYRDGDVYISLVRASILDSLKDRAEVILMAANSDQLTQNDQLDAMLKQKVRGLAVNLVDVQAASFVLDQSKKAGIPVVFFNREPDLARIKSYARTCFIGTVPSAAGKMQGDIIKQLWDAHPEYDRNGDKAVQYMMLQANADNPESVARTEFSVKQARELGLNMRQIGQTLMCEWDEDRAYDAVRMALPHMEESLEMVIANNDSMALGAVRALREIGWNTGEEGAKYIPVIGVDATPQAVEAIRRGLMSATVKQDGKRMGEAIGAITLNAVKGAPMLEGTDWAWDDSGIGVRVPYAPYLGREQQPAASAATDSLMPK